MYSTVLVFIGSTLLQVVSIMRVHGHAFMTMPPSRNYVALFSSYFLASLVPVEGHGYMLEPPSRSYSAWQTGLDYGAAAGVPPRDYCAWCININEGVCGITQSGINYDDWLDSTGQPMPWQSQATYTAGDVITVSSILTAHHEGHLEVWGCPKGRASTQECFREHKLDFVDDVSFGMPQDPNYPRRGYFYGGWDYSDTVMTMRFQLPQNLVGEEVLLQWWYFTANSCTPEGYAEYMARNNLPDSFWSPDTSTCMTRKVLNEYFWFVTVCLLLSVLTYCCRQSLQSYYYLFCGPIITQYPAHRICIRMCLQDLSRIVSPSAS